MHFHSFVRLFIRVSLNSGTAGRYTQVNYIEHSRHTSLPVSASELELVYGIRLCPDDALGDFVSPLLPVH